MRLPQVAGTLILCWVSLLGCAAPVSRTLQSISVSGSAAASSGNVVQFTATDHWTASPMDTAPIAPQWGTCGLDSQPTTAISVTQAGLATCTKGATGSFEVFVEDPRANTGPVCNVIDACGRGCQIMGSAQITCQ